MENRLQQDIARIVSDALKEDLGGKLDASLDITAQLIPAEQKSVATVITREDCVFCGTECVNEVFRQLGGNVEITWHAKEGDRVAPNGKLFTVSGPSREILTAERTCLNFVQTLSGVATEVSKYAAKLEGSQCRLLDTRKTIPGLRNLLKYAVTVGGGHNHRIGLFDAYLIKENHIMACGGIENAVAEARRLNPGKKVEVEVENLEELKTAMDVGADMVINAQDVTDQMVDTLEVFDFGGGELKVAYDAGSEEKTIINIKISMENGKKVITDLSY